MYICVCLCVHTQVCFHGCVGNICSVSPLSGHFGQSLRLCGAVSKLNLSSSCCFFKVKIIFSLKLGFRMYYVDECPRNCRKTSICECLWLRQLALLNACTNKIHLLSHTHPLTSFLSQHVLALARPRTLPFGSCTTHGPAKVNKPSPGTYRE